MRHGIPFDVAFQLDDLTRTAWSIVCSEQGGAKFNWNRMAFDEAES